MYSQIKLEPSFVLVCHFESTITIFIFFYFKEKYKKKMHFFQKLNLIIILFTFRGNYFNFSVKYRI